MVGEIWINSASKAYGYWKGNSIETALREVFLDDIHRLTSIPRTLLFILISQEIVLILLLPT